MRTLFMILAAKAFDMDAGLGDRGEGLHVQALVTQRAVEGPPALFPGLSVPQDKLSKWPESANADQCGLHFVQPGTASRGQVKPNPRNLRSLKDRAVAANFWTGIPSVTHWTQIFPAPRVRPDPVIAVRGDGTRPSPHAWRLD